MALERGVVHENVEGTERVDDGADSVITELRIAHVAGDQQTAPSFRNDCTLGHLGVALFLLDIHNCDVRAFAGK